MSFFDKLKQQAAQTVKQAVGGAGNTSYTVVLRQIPMNLAQLQAMPEA